MSSPDTTRTGPIAESPLPADATWNDYVTAHGGPEQAGWWVTLCWYADAEHPRPEAVGPYRSYEQAVCAMEDSLLIDSFAEDTQREEWLDDVYVATEPAWGGMTSLITPPPGPATSRGARAPPRRAAPWCPRRPR